MAVGRVAFVNRSAGGVPKTSVPAAFVSRGGLEGDRQRDLRYHGGPDRAVSLFSLDLIEQLGAEGHPIEPGTTGENLTVAGLDWCRLAPGAVVQAGEAVLVVTGYATPCRNIEGSFVAGNIARISQKAHPGWSRLYARVRQEGVVRAGDRVEILEEAVP